MIPGEQPFSFPDVESLDRGVIHRIAKWLLFLAISPLLLLLSLILSPVLIFAIIRNRRRQREFRARYDGRGFLVCTSRRGWYDFIENNVQPVLPSSVTLCWAARKSRPGISFDVWQATPLRARSSARPYMLTVRRTAIRAIPLHEKLLPLKAHAKKSLDIQVQVAEIMRAVLEDSRII